MINFLKNRWRGDATRLLISPPEPLIGRSGIALVAIVKDEESHIADWIRFHTIAGAKAIFLYDNGSTDETIRIARELTEIDLQVIPWIIDIRLSRSGVKLWRQPLAYAHAVCTFGHAFEWMTFIDIDEYLFPLLDNTIPEALARIPKHPNISLPWTMYGFNGHAAKPDTPIPFAYEMRAAKRAPKLLNFKCIVDPCDVTKVQVHKFETRTKGTETMNDAGKYAMSYKDRIKPCFASSEVLQLNHYYTFSKQELELKIDKGGVSLTERKRRELHIRRIVEAIESDTVSDTAARDFLSRRGISEVNFLDEVHASHERNMDD